jgi:hypothetical protein
VDIFASQRVFTAPDNSFNESMATRLTSSRLSTGSRGMTVSV